MLHPGDAFDGYRLIRRIGSGGFGEVWLCRSDTIGDLKALKFVTADRPEMLEKELGSLIRYRQAANDLRSPHLMPIEHINRTADGLFYIMPLADGHGAANPEDPEWVPWTFERMVIERQGEWFSSKEIAEFMAPVLDGLQAISDAGLVHRDVKPTNILFLGGRPCLADISLLGEDSTSITRRGTPGYAAPSWYVESGGNPDMFGAATTLYTLLTGNAPDKLGRSKFWWPPQGEACLSPEEHLEWKRLHAVIRRAVEEKPGGRFVDFRAFGEALDPAVTLRAPQTQRWLLPAMAALVLLVAGIAILIAHNARQHAPPLLVTAAPSEPPPPTPLQTKQPTKTESLQLPSKADPAVEATLDTTGEKSDAFRASLADFDKELEKMGAWLNSYTKNFREKEAATLEKINGFAKADLPTTEDRLKALHEIDSALVAVIDAKPDLTPKEVSDKLARKFDALANEVLIQAKSSEDRARFFDQLRPEMASKYKKAFGILPGESFTGAVLNRLTMAFSKALQENYDTTPPSAGTLAAGSGDLAKRTKAESVVTRGIQDKLIQLNGN